MTKVGDFQRMVEHYQELLQRSPDDIALYTNLAWCYERAGRYGDAIQEFHWALDLDQRDFDAHYGMGLALLGEGRTQEALHHFMLARDLVASESSDRSEIVMMTRQVEILVRRLSRS